MDESTLSGSNNSNSLGNSQTTGMSYGTGPGSIAASSAAMSSSIVSESGIAFSAEVAGNLSGSGPKIGSGQKITQYTFPGVLHFLQNEWTKVELERSQWEIDKAELQAKIAFLQGERRGQDNLKGDLIRRIKMLEFTLKQERDKFNKMKNGTEMKQSETRPVSDDQATGINTETVSGSSATRNVQESGSGSNVNLNSTIVTSDTKNSAKCVTDDTGNDTKTNDASHQPDQMNETIIFLEKPQIKEEKETTSPADLKNDKEHYFDSDNDFGISSLTWKQGRQILRQYLKEIGCTDTILDLRSSKIKDLLRNNYTNEQRIIEENQSNTAAYKTNMQNYENSKKTGNLKERMTQFYPFFNAHNILINDPNDESDNVSNTGGENNSSRNRGELILDPMDSYNYRDRDRDRERCQNLDGDMDIEEDDIDAQAQQVYDELTLMSAWEKMSQNKLDQSSLTSGTMIKNNAGSHMMNSVLYKTVSAAAAAAAAASSASAATAVTSDQASSEATMLGELADLAINSDAADAYGTISGSGSVGGVVNVSGMTDPSNIGGASIASALDSSKTWNAKFTLRSHFDCVRALAFDYAQPVLVTGSDDCTLKLWNLQKSSSTKKFASLDIEPMYTFRNHTSPVLCVALDNDGLEDDRDAYDRKLFSADLKGALYSWNLPNFSIDAYDSYQSNILDSSLIGHTDAIYNLVYYQSFLLSCSADKSLKLWSPKASKSNNSDPLKSSFVNSNDNLTPTSADFLKLQSCQFAAGYDNGTVNVYDYETGKSVLNFDSVVSEADLSIGSHGSLIYSLVAHPTMSLIVTAHEDRNIRYWDYKSGILVHSIVAHLDAVTCLTLDPNGQYLLSGSHDSSIRLWNLATKTCVQEITVHRMKCDESILNVAFHPSRQFIASAGADGIAKVFVSA